MRKENIGRLVRAVGEDLWGEDGGVECGGSSEKIAGDDRGLEEGSLILSSSAELLGGIGTVGSSGIIPFTVVIGASTRLRFGDGSPSCKECFRWRE